MTESAGIAVRLEGAGLDRSVLEARYADWRERTIQMHQGTRARPNPTPAFTPLRSPLSTARVALVTTAGAYVAGDEPFNVADPHGDPSYRVIADTVSPDALRFAHSHYDTGRAREDPNVVLPLAPLGDLARMGVVKESAPRHIGLMGFNPDPSRLVTETIPAVVDLLSRDNVDVVVLSPG